MGCLRSVFINDFFTIPNAKHICHKGIKAEGIYIFLQLLYTFIF